MNCKKCLFKFAIRWKRFLQVGHWFWLFMNYCNVFLQIRKGFVANSTSKVIFLFLAGKLWSCKHLFGSLVQFCRKFLLFISQILFWRLKIFTKILRHQVINFSSSSDSSSISTKSTELGVSPRSSNDSCSNCWTQFIFAEKE